jgi:hypothetical protein
MNLDEFSFVFVSMVMVILKCFLFKNILKYFFIFKKLFLTLKYQNNLKIINRY